LCFVYHTVHQCTGVLCDILQCAPNVNKYAINVNKRHCNNNTPKNSNTTCYDVSKTNKALCNLAFAEGDFVIFGHLIDYIGITVAFVVIASTLTILSLLDNYLQGNTTKMIGKRFILPITYLFAVSLFTAPIFYLYSEKLQLGPFCLMNRREPICTEKRKELDCFNKGKDHSNMYSMAI